MVLELNYSQRSIPFRNLSRDSVQGLILSMSKALYQINVLFTLKGDGLNSNAKNHQSDHCFSTSICTFLF